MAARNVFLPSDAGFFGIPLFRKGYALSHIGTELLKRVLICSSARNNKCVTAVLSFMRNVPQSKVSLLPTRSNLPQMNRTADPHILAPHAGRDGNFLFPATSLMMASRRYLRVPQPGYH